MYVCIFRVHSYLQHNFLDTYIEIEIEFETGTYMELVSFSILSNKFKFQFNNNKLLYLIEFTNCAVDLIDTRYTKIFVLNNILIYLLGLRNV